MGTHGVTHGDPFILGVQAPQPFSTCQDRRQLLESRDQSHDAPSYAGQRSGSAAAVRHTIGL